MKMLWQEVEVNKWIWREISFWSGYGIIRKLGITSPYNFYADVYDPKRRFVYKEILCHVNDCHLYTPTDEEMVKWMLAHMKGNIDGPIGA